jgi:hypothetical protein
MLLETAVAKRKAAKSTANTEPTSDGQEMNHLCFFPIAWIIGINGTEDTKFRSLVKVNE